MNPKVTVLMATYNRAHFLPESIESILKQTFSDFEFLIVDDASTDNTVEVLSQYQDSRIRIIRNKENLGANGSRNQALKKARGSYLAILDSDDIATPDRLKLQCDFMDAHSEIAACGGNARFINADGVLRADYNVPLAPSPLNMILPFENPFIHSTVLFRTSVWREFGGYRPLTLAEDYDLFLRISEKYKVVNIDDCLVYYRVHGENISGNLAKMKESEYAVLRDMHNRWEIPRQLNRLDIHHSFIRREFERFSISDYLQLLACLKEANSRAKYYPEKAFNKYLLNRAFEVIQAKREEVGRRAISIFLGNDLFHWSYVTPKQIRRIFKQSLKGILVSYAD